MHDHFNGASVAAHLAHTRAQNRMLSESHGSEPQAPLPAAADALRETTIALTLIWLVLEHLNTASSRLTFVLAVFAMGWVVWKAARAAWLSWSKLERLHRIVTEERDEIASNRPQEREELIALYRVKGFEGQLLEDVVDVLMTDDDRLLTVMLEEEMGFTLEVYEHPLKQALGACIGAALAGVIFVCQLSLLSNSLAPFVTASCLIGAGAFLSAWYEGNDKLSAVVWNISIAALCCSVVYFGLDMMEAILGL